MAIAAVLTLCSASWQQRLPRAGAIRHASPVSILSAAPVGVFTSDVCIGHDPGWMHPEKPERLSNLLRALRGPWRSDFGDKIHILEPEVDVTEEQLLRVHTPAHVKQLKDAFEKVQRGGLTFLNGNRVNIDSDTIVSRGTQAAASRAAGLVIAAVDEVMCPSSKMRRAFVMVRPPGHHAEADGPQGFCLYNNVMVGVAHAQAMHGIRRAAVLDFDVHHGNGDEAIAWDDRTRLYASSHQSPFYPGTGLTPGRSGAHGQIWNCPLPPGAGSEEFRDAWSRVLLPAVRRFRPEALFVSAGFDAHAQDPLASLALGNEDFAWLTAEIASLGSGRLPIISVLEGGYNVEVLERAAHAHLGALISK